jgi:hypothetical protein
MGRVLDRDAASGRSGGLTLRIGLVLAAIIVGALVPVGVSALVGARDPLPPSCHSGPPSAAPKPAELLFADQSALSLVEGDLAQPRKLVDYSPAGGASASPGATLSPGASPAAPAPASPPAAPASAAPASPSVPTASGSSGASPSAGAEVPAAQFTAATISADHKLVAFLVVDPPGAPGLVSLRLVDLSQPPPYAPAEAWNGPKVPGGGRSEIVMLPNGAILFRVPQRFDAPERSTRLVGVTLAGAPPKVVQLSPEEQFTASLHATWPETKDYQLPDQRPGIQDRVLGPGDRVAGRLDRRFTSPLADRMVHQVVAGKIGQDSTRVLCGALDDLLPAAISPDGKTVALTDGTNSHALDMGGGHSTVFLLRGRVLDWRA